MAISNEFRDYVLDLFSALGPVTAKRMFGGAGLYYRDAIFAIVFDDSVALKGNETTGPEMEDAGFTRWTYDGKGKPVAMPYWMMPEEFYDDEDDRMIWARKAVDVGLKTKTSKKPKV